MDHDHDQGMANNNMNHAEQMQMFFYSGKNLTLLFSGWVTTTGVQYGFTLLAVFCFALVHQFLSYLVHHQSPSPSPADEETKQGNNRVWLVRVLLALVSYAAYTSTSFLLMLMVMSFNVGVFIAVVAGLSFGILLFPKKKNKKSLLVQSSSPSPQSGACP